MVQQRPGASGGGGTGSPSGGSASRAAWIVGSFIVAVIVISSARQPTATNGSSQGNEAMAAVMGNAQQALVSAVTAQTLPPPMALSPAAVRRGAARVRLADRESTAGEMIYSQNCYDALGRTFSWRKLDECGAFDAEAGTSIAEDQSAAPTETAWFEPETAAGRYLKAAIAAGLEATSADERLVGLQRQVARRHPVAASPSPAAQPTGDDAGDRTSIRPPIANSG